MARPPVDKAIRPCTRKKSVAVRRMTCTRQAINESAHTRIDGILREDRALTDSVRNLIGNINSVHRCLEDGQVLRVRDWCVDVVAQALAILACYDKC